MLVLKSLLCIYFHLILFISKCISKDYCSADTCNNNKQHTLCKFQSPHPANHCIDVELLVKTTDEKRAILNKINSRRNKVASGEIKSLPPAESMRILEWNVELEISAQRWANQCVKHSVPDIKDMCRDLGPMFVEQNIATVLGEAPGLSPLALVDVWYMELLNFNASLINRYQTSVQSKYSHYDYFTQLVWANTSHVGCGGIKFKEEYEVETGLRNRTIYRLVCNFAPGGNRQNVAVYTSGSPCSRCSQEYSCDQQFHSLCGLQNPTESFERSNIVSEVEFVITTPTFESYDYTDIGLDYIKRFGRNETIETTNEIKLIPPYETQDEEIVLTPFHYFSNLHDLTKLGPEATKSQLHTCKDDLAVDEFIALLKKKLRNDPMFKEFLVTKSFLNNGHSENMFTDPSVAEFVSKLYSKKVPVTPSRITNNDVVNSTLLVDLVEAVIFRSGDKYPIAEVLEENTQLEREVSPIKIQAELPETKQNQDFTGHYFFPEDDEESTPEATESYYDTFNLPVSDVVREIEEIKKITTIKDFIDEIFESDVVVENTSSPSVLSPDGISMYKRGHNVMKKFLENISDKGDM